MSNYFCPRCWKAVLDNLGRPDHIHSCTPPEVIEQVRNAFIAEALLEGKQSDFEDKLIEWVERSKSKPLSDFINI